MPSDPLFLFIPFLWYLIPLLWTPIINPIRSTINNLLPLFLSFNIPNLYIHPPLLLHQNHIIVFIFNASWNWIPNYLDFLSDQVWKQGCVYYLQVELHSLLFHHTLVITVLVGFLMMKGLIHSLLTRISCKVCHLNPRRVSIYSFIGLLSFVFVFFWASTICY